jgi:hypothetical protein
MNRKQRRKALRKIKNQEKRNRKRRQEKELELKNRTTKEVMESYPKSDKFRAVGFTIYPHPYMISQKQKEAFDKKQISIDNFGREELEKIEAEGFYCKRCQDLMDAKIISKPFLYHEHVSLLVVEIDTKGIPYSQEEIRRLPEAVDYLKSVDSLLERDGLYGITYRIKEYKIQRVNQPIIQSKHTSNHESGLILPTSIILGRAREEAKKGDKK